MLARELVVPATLYMDPDGFERERNTVVAATTRPCYKAAVSRIGSVERSAYRFLHTYISA